MNRALLWMALSMAAFTLPSAAQATDIPRAYRLAADEHGVPAAVLYAVAAAESGLALTSGRFRPWPWTLNINGRGVRYPTRDAAHRALEQHLARGTRLIDIGLMQVNWRWHQALLEDPWQALDPYFNLRAGAQLLRRHYDRTGDWLTAIGHYHAPAATPPAQRRASAYTERVLTHLSRTGWTAGEVH